ncbi:D-alanyl-D-alanine carboxypeptidase family protein [Sporosarcina ureae]|uniref:D-alanyl-D-alanine carboxypeptidase family protein n=1 Tax=Sporosarcina ureae TaxID=1571 RepID=UPI000A19ED1E|nr:D-alanyl-D-alanine carboxypeptidase family protein [Sporosarcina ureae]
MKKITSILTICLLGFMLNFTVKEVHAHEFTDIQSYPSADSIEWAYSKGLVGGFEDHTFRPNSWLTEAHFAAILTRYYKVIQDESALYIAHDNKIWSNSIYEALARFKVPLVGYEDRSYRNKPVTRGVLAQVISYVNGQAYQLEKSIQYLFDEQITVGQVPHANTLLEKYGAKNRLTRAQAVLFFHRLDQQNKKEVAPTVLQDKLPAGSNSAVVNKVKLQAISRVDPRVKPTIFLPADKYIEGQLLPEKPIYIKGVLLVNKQYPLPKNYAPGEDRTARAQFTKMAADAKKSGIKLTAFSTYRSFDYQTNLYTKYVKRDGTKAADRYSARPGYSEHQSGLAFDIGEANAPRHWANASFGSTKAGKWLATNAYRYGFVMRYPKGKEDITGYMHESWHYRYVGLALAKEIYVKQNTIEEYVGLRE